MSSFTRVVVCAAAALSMHVAARAQPVVQWERHFGGAGYDEARSLCRTNDGGYVVVGGTLSFGAGGYDVYVVKTDAQGHELWSKTYGLDSFDEAWTVRQRPDGRLVLTGRMYDTLRAEYDFFLLRTDSDGLNATWQYIDEDDWDEARAMILLDNGDALIAGVTGLNGPGERDGYFACVADDRTVRWHHRFGGAMRDRLDAVRAVPTGGFAVAGYTSSFGPGGESYYLVRTDDAGNEVWSKTYGGTDSEHVFAMDLTNDGGFVLTGRTVSFGLAAFDVYVVRTDADGVEVWSRTFGGSSADWAAAVCPTTDGGFILAGNTESFGAGGRDVYALKVSATGDLVWSRPIGGPKDDWAYDAVIAPDGGIVITGVSRSYDAGTGDGDYYLVKLAPPGDADGDGDVDLADFGHFLACFNGPAQPAAGPDCGDMDADGDGDVDLADFGRFLGCFNGPDRPPAAGCSP